jgi:MFS family permease
MSMSMIRSLPSSALRLSRQSLGTATSTLSSYKFNHKLTFTSSLQNLKFNTSNFSTVKETQEPSIEKKGWLEKLFGLESNVASENFKSRWLMVLPAFATHICIGSPYAWSIMADMLTREYGFVLPAASDWSLMQAAFPLSIVFVLHGISGSLVGKWQIKVGARKTMQAAAFAFGGGLLLGAAGIHLHSLPLLYCGYGILAGTGIGLGYTPPVQTLMQWFPDKKGIASGLTIAGFGSGALLFTPCVQYLSKMFAKMPTYLGPAKDYLTQTIDGKLFASVNGAFIEVVNASAAELSKIPYTLPEGLYIVGSGSSGAAEALAVMGAAYFTLMTAAALTMRKPHPSYTVATNTSSSSGSNAVSAVVPDISVEQAMRSPQFYLLGTSFFCLATGGMGLFSVAKPMMSEIFSSVLPAVVTSAFASKFVLMLSGGNLGKYVLKAI